MKKKKRKNEVKMGGVKIEKRKSEITQRGKRPDSSLRSREKDFEKSNRQKTDFDSSQ